MEEKIEKLLKDMESLQRIEERQTKDNEKVIENIIEKISKANAEARTKNDLLKGMLATFEKSDKEYDEIQEEIKANKIVPEGMKKLNEKKVALQRENEAIIAHKRNIQVREQIEQAKQDILDELKETSRNLYNRREIKRIQELEAEQRELKQEIGKEIKAIERNEKLINKNEELISKKEANAKIQEENYKILEKINFAKGILKEVSGIEQEQVQLQKDIEKLERIMENSDEYGGPYLRQMQDELAEKKNKFETNKETMKSKKKQVFVREDGKIETYIKIQEKRYAKNLEKIEDVPENQDIGKLKEKNIKLYANHESLVKKYTGNSEELGILRDNVHMQEARYKQIVAISNIIAEVKKLDINGEIDFNKVRESIAENMVIANNGKELSYDKKDRKPEQKDNANNASKPEQKDNANNASKLEQKDNANNASKPEQKDNVNNASKSGTKPEIIRIEIGNGFKIKVYDPNTREFSTRRCPFMQVAENLKLDEKGKIKLISDIIGGIIDEDAKDIIHLMDPNYLYALDLCMRTRMAPKEEVQNKLYTYIDAINGGKNAQNKMAQILSYQKVNKLFRRKSCKKLNECAHMAEWLNITKMKKEKTGILSKLFGKKEKTRIEQIEEKDRMEEIEEMERMSFAERMADEDLRRKTNEVSAKYVEDEKYEDIESQVEEEK